jgi:hypothetical protein
MGGNKREREDSAIAAGRRVDVQVNVDLGLDDETIVGRSCRGEDRVPAGEHRV